MSGSGAVDTCELKFDESLEHIEVRDTCRGILKLFAK